MSLNILCAICSDYFKNSDIIYSTRCGHVFHKFCLFHWLKASRTCPQCRKHCLRHYCHQLYVNFVEVSIEDGEMEMNLPKTYDWIYLDRDMEFGEDMRFAYMFGLDEEGNDIYAARARFNDDLVPGYYVPNKKSVIAPWGFRSHRLVDDIELLDISNDDAEYKWVAASDGDVPENAFPTGNTIIGDILYTARAKHKGQMLYGKLHQRYYQAYMPYKEKEVTNANYEILVKIPKEVPKSEPLVENETMGNVVEPL